jgi:hypothetical protein
MLGHDLKQLLNGFWMLATELMNQGAARRAVLQGRYDIGTCHTWKDMALL